jgi:hypothetical protein
MTNEPLPYTVPDPIPWRALAGPLAQAGDAIARTHFAEACATLWLEGELVHLEDLVLHDVGMDIRAPTHALVRAHALLRARRRIAAEAPGWALSGGLAVLRGDAVGDAVPEEGRGQLGEPFGAMDNDSQEEDPKDGFDTDAIGDASGRSDGLEAEFAVVDAAIARSQRIMDGDSAPPRPRDPLVYDVDWNEGGRLEAWRAVRDQTRTLPPLLAAAFLWEAWENIEPLQHRPWLGAPLVAAHLRERRKTNAHLLCLNTGLRLMAREHRRAANRTARLAAWADAVAAAAEAGMKEHDRWLLARQLLERKLVGRRRNSHMGAMIDMVLAHPIANVGLIAQKLGVSTRAAQNLVAELGLREATGRGRYRAWGIL